MILTVLRGMDPAMTLDSKMSSPRMSFGREVRTGVGSEDMAGSSDYETSYQDVCLA